MLYVDSMGQMSTNPYNIVAKMRKRCNFLEKKPAKTFHSFGTWEMFSKEIELCKKWKPVLDFLRGQI